MKIKKFGGHQMSFLNKLWNFKFFDKRNYQAVQIQVKEVIKEVPRDSYYFANPPQNKEFITIEPHSTFKVHDLANMFPFNITPALIESKIQHAIAAKQSMLNRLTPQFVIMFIMILIGATVAGVILWKFMGGGQQEVIVKLAPGLQSAGIQATITNLTG